MQNIGQRILNETNLLINDEPHFFPGMLENPEEYLTWGDVEWCFNRPEYYNFEIIDPITTYKVNIPAYTKTWVWDRQVQDKEFVIEKINRGYGFVITNYSCYNHKVNDLCMLFEKMYDVNAAVHVYGGIDKSSSFPIHDDYPANFIFQIEGETRWKIFKNRISAAYRTGTMNGKLRDEDLDVAIDVVMKPGDVLYIPSRMFHRAYPDAKRLSMSMPLWCKYATDAPTASIDRKYYRINHGKI